MSWQATIVMDASLLSVRRAAQVLKSAIADVGTPESRNELELAFVEACTNSARHGSKGGGRADVQVTIQIDGADVSIVVEDGGEAFDPFAAERDIDLNDIASLPCGGYGLALIRKICDAVEYEHTSRGNRLALRKRLASTGAAAIAGGGV